MLDKPKEYKEIKARQNDKTIYAEDINQIIKNIELIKGGASSEAPAGNIKDIYERLNRRADAPVESEGGVVSSRCVSFDNSKINLDFSSDEDNFPPIKKQLKEIYNIKLIDESDIAYNFVLEKNNDKYIFKGSIKETLSKSSFMLKISEFDGIKDGGLIIAELSQFFYCGKKSQSKENEIKNESTNSNLFFKYTFNNAFGMPVFNIYNDNIESNNEKQIIIFNIDIPIENIQNGQNYILASYGNLNYTYLKIENQNNRVFIKGNITCPNNSSQIVIYSNGILENYFNIEDNKSDSLYIKAIEGYITSNTNKDLKYYIRKEISDLSSFQSYIENATVYCIEVKHSDGTNIETDEIISFNMATHKNTDIYKIQKEINIQSAIEVLDKKVNELMNHLRLGDNFNIYNFEKSEILIGENTLTDNNTKDCSNLTLIKNIEGYYRLKGNIELLGNNSEDSTVIIKTTNKINKKLTRNIIPIIKDEIIGIQLTPLYYNNYLYLHGKFSNGNSITNLDDIKIIDNKICLFNNSIINSAEFSEDFGIYATYGKLPYDNVKYKLKGQLILIESQIMTYTNIGMLDFFEDKINYKISTGKENLQIMISNQGAGTILALSGTAGQTYNLDWELPKQPV